MTPPDSMNAQRGQTKPTRDDGLDRDEIAARLGVARTTVRRTSNAVKAKLSKAA